MHPLISIVIPAYNSEKFISIALDSINFQQFRAYEVLIVDAGSGFETKDICELYDERFIYHELKGSKQGEARNFGVSNAKGKLVMFLDSDDMLSDSNVLTDCIKEVESCDSDFYNFAVSFFKNKNRVRKISVPDKLIIDNRDTILRLGLNGRCIHTIPWNKVYKKKFLVDNKIVFPNLKEQEDMVFVIHCCMKASRVSFANRVIVKAEIRDDSLSRSMSSLNVACCLDVFLGIENLLKSNKILDKFDNDFRYYKMRTSAYILLMAINRVRSDDDFWKGVSIIRKSGALDPLISMSMLSSMKITTVAGIIISKVPLCLAILRFFRKFKLIKGY